jgi:hypothetical protein
MSRRGLGSAGQFPTFGSWLREMAGFYAERKHSTLKLVNRFFCHLTAVDPQQINGREAHIDLNMSELSSS